MSGIPICFLLQPSCRTYSNNFCHFSSCFTLRICTRPKNKKGAPISRSALPFNVARVFRPEVLSTSRPCAVCASRIILRCRRRVQATSTSRPRPSSKLLFSSVGAAQFSPARKRWERNAPCAPSLRAALWRVYSQLGWETNHPRHFVRLSPFHEPLAS